MNNYFSLEADNQYMSCSLLDMFLSCESKTMNYLKGTYSRSTSSTALIVGNYVHAWAEGTLEKYKEKYKSEIFTNKGTLRSDFIVAENMIRTVEQDEFCMFMLEGESEVTFTGELFGEKWKIRVDKWQKEKNRIIDLKTTKSIHEKTWVDGQKLSFIDVYHYQRRAAVYSEIVKQHTGKLPSFYIVAVSKEAIPDKAIINLTDEERWQQEIYDVGVKMDRIKLVKAGKVEPVRCETCDYCRQTKKVDKIIDYRDV